MSLDFTTPKESKVAARLSVTVFQGRVAPEKARLVGYGAIIDAWGLAMPMPERLALVSYKNRQYKNKQWQFFTFRHQPDDDLYSHLVYAIKYEGINLLFFKRLFQQLSKAEITQIISSEPTGQYSRNIWFLYEWLMQDVFDVDDTKKGNYVPLLNDNLQYTVKGTYSKRYRVINNLPGTPDFCPLVFKTDKLENYIKSGLSEQQDKWLSSVHKEILQRASAFLLLKDSKASFAIEGESAKSKRAARWGNAIGQAGSNLLSKEELLRLQQLVIESARFIKMGFRKEDGFIHPFQDGNGRIHRYLVHYMLARKRFSRQGLIFPVSASILDHIDDYRRVLQQYSQPLLDFIDWETTPDNNVKVFNDTIDYYRYFDATSQAEFLYDCVNDTIYNIIPKEVKYLEQYDQFKRFLDEEFEMPDKTVAHLVRFLEHNNGKLSKRARDKEFFELSGAEIERVEKQFSEIFSNNMKKLFVRCNLPREWRVF